MSTEQKNADQNALAARLGRTWDNFRQGKLISYKLMAVLLIVVAALGTWWYIASESRKARSQQWMELDEASTPSKLQELADREKDSVPALVAGMQLARAELGRDGLELLNSRRPGEHQKGVENTEKGREALAKWLEKAKANSVLKNDPLFRAECYWGLAMAEQGLLGIPKDAAAPTSSAPAAPSTEFRGKLDTLLEHLDQVAGLQAADSKIEIPWAKQARERAETIRKDPEKFQRSVRLLGQAAKADPFDSPVAPKKN